jgi:hypothetical protein
VTPDCGFYRWHFNFTGEPYAVYQHANMKVENKFSFTFNNGTVLSFRDNVFKPQVEVVSTTVSSGSIANDLEELCVIHGLEGRMSFLDRCSNQLSPLAGSPGEVQILNKKWFENPSADGVVWDESLVTDPQVSAKGVHFKVKPSTFKQEKPRKILPYEDHLYTVPEFSEANGLREYRKGSMEPVVVTINKLVMAVKDTQTKACPEICDQTTAYSCTNCETPASWSMKVKSTCGEGWATVKMDGCPYLSPSSIWLNSSCSEILFYCTGNVDSTEEIKIDGNFQVKDDISFQFVERNINAGNDTEGFSTDDDKARSEEWWNPFSWLSNVFNGLGNWLDWIGTVLVFVALGLIFVLSLVGIYKVAVLLKNNKMDLNIHQYAPAGTEVEMNTIPDLDEVPKELRPKSPKEELWL